jgi:putative heme-binding domain-containing protein
MIRDSFPLVRGAAMVAAGGDEIHPQELASWFPEQKPTQPPAVLPIIGSHIPDRQKVVRRYLAQVPALRGDTARGKQVFARACMACHRLGDTGVEVGPDLATVASKPLEQLLEAILDPNRAVELRNATTQATRLDGTSLAGLLVAETPTSITLRLPGGLDAPIPRTQIKELRTLATSLMPEGLEAALTPQDMADLLAHLQRR